eukprot:scaffold3735_cov153-Pinguiococcus_pyrenoidosus.AAC.3
MNLGSCYSNLGEPRRAIEYYEQSLEISKETQDRRGEGQTLNNLGLCYSDLGEARRAIEYYEQSLEIKKETQDRRGEGATLNNLGLCYSDLGEPWRAIEYYEQSLRLFDEMWGALKTDRERATFLHDNLRTSKLLERAYNGINDAENALLTADAWRAKGLHTSMSRGDEVIKADGRSWWQVFTGCARKSLQVDCLSRAQALAERQQGAIVFYSYDNIFKSVLNIYVLRAGARCLHRPTDVSLENLKWDGNHAPNSRDVNLSWRPRDVRSALGDNSVRSSGLDLADLYKVYIEPIENDIKDVAKLIIIPDAAAGIATVPFAALQEPNSGRFLVERFVISTSPSLGVLLQLAERQHLESVELGSSVVVGNPDYSGWVPEAPVLEEEALDVLEVGQTAVLLPASVDRYDAGASCAGADCIVTALANRAAGKSVECEVTLCRWDGLLGDMVRVKVGGKWMHATVLADSEEIGSVHVQELGKAIDIPKEAWYPCFIKGDQVTVLADGFRGFDAAYRSLHSKGTIRDTTPDEDGRYEVILEQSETEDGGRHETKGQDMEGSVVVHRDRLLRRMRVSPTRLLRRTSKSLAPLRNAEREARAVAGVLGVPEGEVLVGSRATKDMVMGRLRNTQGVVHIATHGLVDPQVGGRSGVALCGSSHESAVLTAHDVASIKLRTPLVVLSACDTGLGESMAEGVLGLARAFTLSGADSVIMSLWRVVDDEATSELMKKFYENLLQLAELDPADSSHQRLHKSLPVAEAWAKTVRACLHRDRQKTEVVERVLEYFKLGESETRTLSDLLRKCKDERNALRIAGKSIKHITELRNDLESLTTECDPDKWAGFSVVSS